MSPRVVRIVTGSRLHFGMFSFGQPHHRSFGGVGAMLTEPGWDLTLRESNRFQVHGPEADRVGQCFLRLAAARTGQGGPACRVEVATAVPAHAGLGSGTQLALALAVAIERLYAVEPGATLCQLARRAGRCRRSAVGTYGFAGGGLIVEDGVDPTGDWSPLLARVCLPSDWRFVLARPTKQQGISGAVEQRAFEVLPPVPVSTTARLRQLAGDELLPAARQGDHPRFALALWEYGVVAGECFAEVQGGPFASPAIAQLVEAFRGLGAKGVGQTSWGPTVFATFSTAAQAESVAAELDATWQADPLAITVAQPARSGARLWVDDVPSPLPPLGLPTAESGEPTQVEAP